MARHGKIVNRLHTAARLSRTALAGRLLDHGLHAGQDRILLVLSERDGQTPGELADRLGVRPPTVAKTIARLQVQGFLLKRASEKDGRCFHVHLTPTGRAAIRVIERSIRRMERQALKGFDKKDQKILTRLLARIEANLSCRAETATAATQGKA